MPELILLSIVRDSLRGPSSPLLAAAAKFVAALPSPTLRRMLIARIDERDEEAIFDAVGTRIHGAMTLENVPFDLPPTGQLEFEDLAGLFPSSPLAYGVALMTPRQLAYLFGVARRTDTRAAIEIGRYKGGATIAIAAGMGKEGTLWSIDNGSLEASVARRGGVLNYDRQIRKLSERFGLSVQLLVGDSRTFELDVDGVDLVFIDGDHSYEGAKADFSRWGRRVRIGGHVLMDDAFPLGRHRRGSGTVEQVVSEVVREGDFRLARVVDRLADLERIR